MVALLLLERIGMLSAIACGTDALSFGVAGILELTPGGCGKEAMLMDFRTSLFPASSSWCAVELEIDRSVGTVGVECAEAALGDTVGLMDRDGVRKASLDGV